MEEIWKDIPRYPTYQASSFGNIRRFVNGKFKDVKPFMNTDGYLQVSVEGCPTKLPGVSRLVGYAFLGECPKGYIIDHLNNKHDDNRACNLEYITRAENLRRAKLAGRNPKAFTKVRCIQTGEVFKSIKAVSLKFNVRYESMRYIVDSGKPVNGYTFERVE